MSMVRAAAKCVKWACFYALFLVLVFGWSDSPGEYGVFGWGVSQAHRSLGPSSVVQLPLLAFFNMCFVDDAAVFELDMYGRAEESCRAYDWSLFQMLGRCLNLKKLAVGGMLGASHTFWGVTYHLERAAEGVIHVWVELTRSKKQKAATMMRLPSSQPGIRRVLLNDHQRLTGNVQWRSVCAPALRGLLGCFYAMSASTDAIWLAPPGSVEEQEILWREYDEPRRSSDCSSRWALATTRTFSRASSARSTSTKSRISHGGSTSRSATSAPTQTATRRGGILSAIDYEAKTWTFARASEYAPAMLEKLGVAGARMEDDLIIFVTELLAVIALAAENGPAWLGSVVASIIDNDNANIAINTRRSRNRYVRYLLFILTALEFKYKFRMVAYYVNTHSNWLLDGIGRFERFHDRPDDEVREMIQRELIDAHAPGLVFESLSTLLGFFTSGETVMRTFALPDGSISELAAEFVH